MSNQELQLPPDVQIIKKGETISKVVVGEHAVKVGDTVTFDNRPSKYPDDTFKIKSFGLISECVDEDYGECFKQKHLLIEVDGILSGHHCSVFNHYTTLELCLNCREDGLHWHWFSCML